jgi:predicted Zn-dependent peptidase
MSAYPERIEAVGADDLLRTARRIIQLDAYTLAVVRP